MSFANFYIGIQVIGFNILSFGGFDEACRSLGSFTILEKNYTHYKQTA